MRRPESLIAQLLLTSTLLAQAQSDANYFTEVMNHAVQFDVSENLVWDRSSNPEWIV